MKCKDDLEKLDKKLYSEVSKDRKKSDKRDKSVIVTDDIITIFKAFEGNDITIEIFAKDMASVPMTNLEAAKLLSLADRVQKYENNIYTLTEENIALKRSMEIMDAKHTELTGIFLYLKLNLRIWPKSYQPQSPH